MKIVLLSDLHLTELNALAKNDFDVNAQFFRILNHLSSIEFDHIIVLGDVCLQEGNVEIYNWFLDEIEKFEKPFDLISGNDDDSELIIKLLDYPTFDPYDEKIYYQKDLGGKSCYFLDTSSYMLPTRQLEWLKEKLKEEEDIFVFMHHPPCNGGVPFMDINYPLKNRKEVLALFKYHPGNVEVFCGHYHVEKTILHGSTNIHIAPSPYYVLDENEVGFEILHQNPCFQLLTIEPSSFHLETIYL